MDKMTTHKMQDRKELRRLVIEELFGTDGLLRMKQTTKDFHQQDDNITTTQTNTTTR